MSRLSTLSQSVRSLYVFLSPRLHLLHIYVHNNFLSTTRRVNKDRVHSPHLHMCPFFTHSHNSVGVAISCWISIFGSWPIVGIKIHQQSMLLFDFDTSARHASYAVPSAARCAVISSYLVHHSCSLFHIAIVT